MKKRKKKSCTPEDTYMSCHSWQDYLLMYPGKRSITLYVISMIVVQIFKCSHILAKPNAAIRALLLQPWSHHVLPHCLILTGRTSELKRIRGCCCSHTDLKNTVTQVTHKRDLRCELRVLWQLSPGMLIVPYLEINLQLFYSLQNA